MPTLSSVCELIVDSEHKTAPAQSQGYPLIRTPNIGRGRFILDDVKRVSDETYNVWTRRAVPRRNDLILAREAPVGNVAIVPANLNPCLGQRTVLIRPDERRVDPVYLVYLLLGDEVQGTIQSLSTGATVAHLNMADIRNLRLPRLPSLWTQRKIASVLSAYDDLIENNTRRIEILEEMAQRIYREWFVHFRFPGHEKVGMMDSELGPIPEGWEVIELGEIAEQVRRNVKPEQFNHETPYVGLEHIPRRSIALSDWSTVDGVQSSKLAFKRGEILFGKIRPYFHKVAVAPMDGLCSSDTIVISSKDAEYFSVVLSVVSSEGFVNHATQTSQGTKMPRADWNVLVKYPVVIPTTTVLERFDDLLQNVVKQIQNLIFRNKNLRQTRDLLLPKLISGEVDVEDLDVEVGADDLDQGM